MPLPAIRQRIGRLEAVFVVDQAAGFPPLTSEEIEGMVGRLAEGQEWTDVETARVVKQCPFIEGELLITTGLRGEVLIKRYIGVDTAWV